MEALAYYTVELTRPPAGWGQLPQMTARARHACGEAEREGIPVRFLRSIFVPEDNACLFIFEGPTGEAVRAAAERAGLNAKRVQESVVLQPAS